MDILIGSTDQWVRVRAMTAAGAALTGKLATDFAFWYAREGAAPVSITPLADKSAGDAHADGGVYEEGRGWYWVGVPDAAFVAGVPSVGISGTVAGGVVLDAPIRLKYSLQSADSGATAVARIGADSDTLKTLSDQLDTIKTDTGNLVSRITANLFSGITSLANWLGALAGKTADTATRAEINATTAGAGYNETTDSQEAIADAQLTAAQAFAAVLTTQMTEAYAEDGVAPTLTQAIFLIQQSLHEFSLSGTTRTVKKLDGLTTAATFTLDDADAPTSTTRAS